MFLTIFIVYVVTMIVSFTISERLHMHKREELIYMRNKIFMSKEDYFEIDTKNRTIYSRNDE